MQRKGLKRRPFLCTPSRFPPNHANCCRSCSPVFRAPKPPLRSGKFPSNLRLDDSDHFSDNQLASVAALRSLIGFRRNADRLPSGTLIDFTGIRTQLITSLRDSPEHTLTENAVFCSVGLRHRMPLICCP